jgi:ribosome maturation factor RimP
MNQILEKIDNIAKNTAENLGFFVVDISVRGDRNKRIIEIYVDGDKSISADDLAEISREIGKKFEEDNQFDFAYRLDVSSPGTDRPLKFLRQYPKHLNRKFDISYKSGDDIVSFKGKLTGVEDIILSFYTEDKKEIKLKFDEIIKSKVIISFS